LEYRRIKPGAEAAQYVEFYWTLEDSAPAAAAQIVISDGRTGIIINFAQPFESAASGAWTCQPQCFFVGQITRPLLLRPSGCTAIIGIQFRPSGAAPVLGLPMTGLADSEIDLQDLSQKLHQEFARIRDFSSMSRALQALDPLISSLANRNRLHDDQLSQAIAMIHRSGGLINIDSVAQSAGWSARHLQRQFKDRVGVSPKFFARMQRFQGVLRAMDDPTLNWANTANQYGYFDQAHLIRYFRQFAGKPPTALLDQELDLTKRFVKSIL
jgi:AraC-like DNA-binding protein